MDLEDREAIKQYIEDQRESYSKPIVVEVEKLDKFYDAEELHQEYLEKNPSGYCHINFLVLKDEERQEPIRNKEIHFNNINIEKIKVKEK